MPPRRQSAPLSLGELATTWTKSRRWNPDSDYSDDVNGSGNQDDQSKRNHRKHSFLAVPISGNAEENAELAREQRIQYWLEDPIRCGYLRAFSQSEVTAMTAT